MPSSSVAHADLLAAREQVILDRYRQRLTVLNSPLSGDEHLWTEAEIQARRVLGDCVMTLRVGHTLIGDVSTPAISSMAVRRGSRGVQPAHSVRAARALFDVIFTEVRDVVATSPEAARLTAEVALALDAAIGSRLEAGALGYETFLLNQVREAIDSDRRDLARELHDRPCNTIALALRGLELAQEGDDATLTPAMTRRLERVRVTLVDALEEVGQLIRGLRDRSTQGALLPALESYASSVQMSEPDVTIVINGVESWAPPGHIDEVFLILRECLRNTFQHARARRVTVKVDVAPHELRAAVEDDGIGFDPARAERGSRVGLHSMRERARSLNGQLAIHSEPGQGTRVSLWIPFEEREVPA